ncbi:ABC transporter permease [Desulfovibrio inopinatus]|uniref:ABC transporter permease n=1 Tax=Desulfovibrio inopinatus TaxID=102109 RepID=UPI00040759DE|nr:ABC transporter permease [Desulfovibrio inopinatus]
MNDLIFIAALTVKSSIAVFLASLGEIVAERAGVVNLGLEGMMLFGALAGFVVGMATQNSILACGAAMLAGACLACVHAVFAVIFKVNQILSGIAITLFGVGLANFLGRPYTGKLGLRLGDIALPGLSSIPVVGPIFFNQNVLVYAAAVLCLAVWFFLYRTRPGLALRACGESPAAADAGGVGVDRMRFGAVVFGGLLAGLGGSYLSLAYTPGFKESMTGGQGWIAVAMVIFSGWKPVRAFAGALLFGGLTALQFFFQAIGVEIIPLSLLRILPYLLTIIILAFATWRERVHKSAFAPQRLGIPFFRE